MGIPGSLSSNYCKTVTSYFANHMYRIKFYGFVLMLFKAQFGDRATTMRNILKS